MPFRLLFYPLCPIVLSRCATALGWRHLSGAALVCRVGQEAGRGRRPHISIDVRQGEAYALSVEEACKYNPHIA
jgi:hypothetical protein